MNKKVHKANFVEIIMKGGISSASFIPIIVRTLIQHSPSIDIS